MANTTWNPADKDATISLSGGNLTATCTGGGFAGARAIDKQITGKHYWECTITTWTSSSSAIGIASINWARSSSLSATPPGTCALNRAGTITSEGATAGINFGTIANGTVVCMAVDASARLMWYRLGAAGNWNNSATANPATGAGGVAITMGLGIALYPALTLVTLSDAITANFGDSAFTGSVPSGFAAGFVAGVTSPNNALATQAALEQWITTNPQAQVTQIALEEWVVLAGGTAPPTVTSKQYAVSIVS